MTASSRISNRHSALAKAVALQGESPRLFNELVDKLNAPLKPETDLDHILIGKMAAAHWRQNRIGARERKGEKFDDVEMSLARQFPAASIATCASAL